MTELDVKCDECGADLKYQPGTTSLVCDYCQHAMQIAVEETAVAANEELDLQSYLDNFTAQSEQVERQVVNCESCGAETELEAHQQSGSCPFCGTPLLAEQTATKQFIQPKGLLPFKIVRKDAREAFKKWLSSLWFVPNDLKKQIVQHDKFKGVYLPYWTYDCATYTSYSGQRGEYYYVTETVTDSEGKEERREVRKTQWYPVTGWVDVGFDDVLVPATKSLPHKMLNKLQPWDLEELVDYKPDYLSGYVTESYQVSLAEGYEEAQDVMEQRIRSAIEDDIGGDEQLIDSFDTQYTDATFKHMLLPVWISAYHYKDKLYQVLVNARTGEVQGKRPYSWAKIALTVVGCIVVIGGGLYLLGR